LPITSSGSSCLIVPYLDTLTSLSFFLVHHVKPNSFVPNPLRRYTEGLSASWRALRDGFGPLGLGSLGVGLILQSLQQSLQLFHLFPEFAPVVTGQTCLCGFQVLPGLTCHLW
jgi:hypothetical protein